MNILHLCLNTFLLGLVLARRPSYYNDNYQVMGVNCEENEVVSCLLVECSGGDYCPAENYCFNPKCVCRKGYRKVRGVCIPKHASLYLKPKVLETALLEMPYREDFSLKKY